MSGKKKKKSEWQWEGVLGGLITLFKRSPWDFPGGVVVKNPPANAGDTGSSPGPGKIPHATEQLSP